MARALSYSHIEKSFLNPRQNIVLYRAIDKKHTSLKLGKSNICEIVRFLIGASCSFPASLDLLNKLMHFCNLGSMGISPAFPPQYQIRLRNTGLGSYKDDTIL